MEELLLQTMVEKLELIEQRVNKQQAHVEANEQALNNNYRTILLQLQEQNKSMVAFIENKQDEVMQARNKNAVIKHAVTKVVHQHKLHKTVWLSVTAICVLIITSMGWMHTYNTAKQMEANDLKYKLLKLTADTALQKVLNHADSLYETKKDIIKLKISEN